MNCLPNRWRAHWTINEIRRKENENEVNEERKKYVQKRWILGQVEKEKLNENFLLDMIYESKRTHARECTHTWIKNQNSNDRRTERDTVTQFVFGCHDRRIVIIFYLNDFGHLMNLLFLLAFHSSSFSAWFVIKSSMLEGSSYTEQKWNELKTFRTVFFSLYFRHRWSLTAFCCCFS